MSLRSAKFGEEIELLHTRRREDRADQRDLADVWVHNDVLSALKNSGNHLLVGRRGMGKTTLLLRLAQELQEEIADRKLLPLYLDCKNWKIAEESRVFCEVGPGPIALKIFLQMFQDIAIELERVVGSIENNKGSVAQWLRSRKQKTIALDLQNARAAIEQGLTILTHADIAGLEEQAESIESDASISGGIGGGSQDGAPILRVEGKQIRSQKRAAQRTRKSIAASVPDVRVAREALGRVCDLLELRIVLLLDDVTRASSYVGVQPLFFDYLQMLLPVKASKVSFKIAAVRNELGLGDKQVGVSRADDLTLVDLDERARSVRKNRPEEFSEFISRILFRHLELNSSIFGTLVSDRLKGTAPELERLHAGHHVWSVLFRDYQKSMPHVVDASYGNPRDAMNILYYSWQVWSVETRREVMQFEDVALGIRRYYGIAKYEDIKHDPACVELIESVRRQMLERAHKTRVFLVRNDALQSMTARDAFSRLEQSRIVHCLDENFRARVNQQSSDVASFSVYEIDQGLIADALLYSRKGASDVDFQKQLGHYSDLHDRMYDVPSSSILQAQILEMTRFNLLNKAGQRSMITCVNCGFQLAISHPVYKKFGICPSCASDPTDPSGSATKK